MKKLVFLFLTLASSSLLVAQNWDLTILPNDVETCDTAGWDYPLIYVQNIGTVTVPSGSSIYGAYRVNGGPWVLDTFVTVTNMPQNDIQMFIFDQPYHFDQFTTYNCMAVVTKPDPNPANDTVPFTEIFHGYPEVFIGNDTSFCDHHSLLLDASTPGATYSWWDASTAPTNLVDSSDCGGIGTCMFYVFVNTYGCVTGDSIYITWTSCTGLEENEEVKFEVYPNPSSGFVNIEFADLNGDIDLDILDLQGRIVYKEEFSSEGDYNKIMLDLRTINSGIYYIRIKSSEGILVKKLLIE